MENLMLSEVVSAVRGSFGFPADIKVENISTDTREIGKDSVFIALKGERFDGHDFAAQAMEKGACAVITEKAVAGAKCIIVDSTYRALLDIAGYYKDKFPVKTVAVTGSVGKTTTKDMVSLVVEQKYKTLKTTGNHNNEVGMPKTLFELDSTYEAAVVEMGMSHFEEISRMSMCAKPDVCVITNIGVSHIENLGSRENILKAKLEILDGADYNAPVVLSYDDKLLANAEISENHPKWYYSVKSKKADVYASDIAADDEGISFTINYKSEKYKARINCLGEHNIKNALAAFCVGEILEIPESDIIKAIALFKPEGLRQNIQEINGTKFVVDCYNAAPDSMKASLDVLKQLKKGKSVAVLGDMLELGEKSKEFHKTVGGYVPVSDVDYLLCYGENSVYYIEGAVSKGFDKQKAFHFDDTEKLSCKLKEIIDSNTAVLLKGSRGMKLERVLDYIK